MLLKGLIYKAFFDAMDLGWGILMKWIKERDDLIAQTRAFVQSVAGRKPQVVTDAVFAEPKPVKKSVAVVAPDPIPPSLPIDNFAAAPPPTGSIQAGAERTSPAALHSDVRREIQNRVAAFKAHQHRFHREREAYFNAVLTKARSSAETGPDVTSN